MKNERLAILALLGVLLCLTLIAVPVSAATKTVYVANLSGSEEVPVVDTNAHGQVIFQLNKDGLELGYRLIAANIGDIIQSHIHLAPSGQNGPIVVFLYGPSLIEGTFNGVLAEGTITSADLLGTLAGQPLSALIEEIDAGNAYVNIHTLGHPSGEIRGQIK